MQLEICIFIVITTAFLMP